jgi:hypothetical protein
MSTWAAFAAKGTAMAATTAAGAGASQAIAPGALDGFAAGALLTGMCFLFIVAPRTAGRSRLSARRSLWSAVVRHRRERPDYYAAPADTHSPVAAEVEATPTAEANPTAEAPDAVVSGATGPGDVLAPELPLSFANPALEVFAPAAGQEYAGHAGADPYAPGGLDPASYAPRDLAAEDFGAAAGFDTSSDDDIVLPGDDDTQERGRGYRSKHRLSGQDSGDRRTEAKRRPARHAAPSARFGSRLSSKLAMFPLVPARG